MLIILVQWLLILYTIVGIGAFITLVYNRLARREEVYSIINSFLIGLCFLVPVLSILRIFIPVNFYIYGLLLILVSIFYFLNKSRTVRLLQEVKEFRTKVSPFMLLLLSAFILVFAYNNAISFFYFDASCYHLQASKWIETYPLVTGIANIEERLGFNSTFHLLSAPFSLSIFFDEPFFFIHSLFILLFLSWSIYKLYQKVSLLSIFSLLVIIDISTKYFLCFFDSNTDMLPNIIVLYLVLYLIDKVDNVKTLTQQSLLIFLVLVAVCTMKLSFSILGLFVLYILFLLWKEKAFRAIVLLICLTTITVLTWLYSNVILSGYLLYPLVDLDLFNVDWKLPKSIGYLEREYIAGGGNWQLHYILRETKMFLQTFNVKYLSDASWSLYNIVLLIGFPIVIYQKWRHKISTSFLVLFFLVFANLLINYKIAPDMRFTFGLLYAGMLLVVGALGRNVLGSKYVLKTLPFVFLILTISLFFDQTSYKMKTSDPIAYIKPLSRMDIVKDPESFKYSSIFLNNGVELILSDHPAGFTMYNAPCVPNDTLYNIDWRFNNFKDLESRGGKLTDGFRTRKGVN